jgi:hypothetical protein
VKPKEKQVIVEACAALRAVPVHNLEMSRAIHAVERRLFALIKELLPAPGTYIARIEESVAGTKPAHWQEWFDPEAQQLVDADEVTAHLERIGRWAVIGDLDGEPLRRRISEIKPKSEVGKEVKLPVFDSAFTGIARNVVYFALNSGGKKWKHWFEQISADELHGFLHAVWDPVVAIKNVGEFYKLPVPKLLTNPMFNRKG